LSMATGVGADTTGVTGATAGKDAASTGVGVELSGGTDVPEGENAAEYVDAAEAVEDTLAMRGAATADIGLAGVAGVMGDGAPDAPDACEGTLGDENACIGGAAGIAGDAETDADAYVVEVETGAGIGVAAAVAAAPFVHPESVKRGFVDILAVAEGGGGIGIGMLSIARASGVDNTDDLCEIVWVSEGGPD
jgi:hypothetical protein